MNILVIQESDYIARGPHQQHHLLERMQSKGNSIRIIDFNIDWKNRSSKSLYQRRRRLIARGKICKGTSIEVIRPGMVLLPIINYLTVFLTQLIEIFRQIKEFRPHVIMGMGIMNTLTAALVSRLYQRPFLFYVIDSLHTLIPERYLRIVGRMFEKEALRQSSSVVVINNHLAKYIRRLCRRCKPEVITAGVDTRRFSPSKNSDAKERLGFSRQDIVLFFMGWLYDFSGLREVAQSIVSYGKSNIKLLALGKGDLYEELVALSEQYPENIYVHGWVPYEEVPQYIDACDFCLLPAHNNEVMRDIVPIKMYEYLASGKPVIATPLPGIVSEFGSNRGVVYAKRPDDVLQKAMDLYHDRSQYEKVSNQACEFAANLGWDTITEKFNLLLLRLISKVRYSN